MTRLAAGDLLTIHQAQAIRPVGRSTLYSLVAGSQIPSLRVRCARSRRGRILIRRADLEAFIEESRRTADLASVRVAAEDEQTNTRRCP